MNIQARGKKFQLRVTHKNLPKEAGDHYIRTFESREDAATSGNYLISLLDRGIVPVELLAGKAKAEDDPVVLVVLSQYLKRSNVSRADEALLKFVEDDLLKMRISDVTYQWAAGLVRKYKVERNLAPSTIRARIGAIKRMLDWHIRETTVRDKHPMANPLKMLPRNFSAYTRQEASDVEESGMAAKVDVERDRRLDQAEEERIIAALDGYKREDRERPWGPNPDFKMLFLLIVNTGMRLREAYWTRVEQVDIKRRVINVKGTKGHHGAEKPRLVPISKALAERLAEYIGKRHSGLLFPFWDGKEDSLRNTTNSLSARFATLFDYADVEDFREHDLRHEATCRWFELRNSEGHWMFSEMEIFKLMGWTLGPSGKKMAARYASIRGEDLAARMDS